MQDRTSIDKVKFTSLDKVFTVGPRVMIEIEEIKSNIVAFTEETLRTERSGKTIGILRKKSKTAFNQMCEDGDEVPEVGDVVGFVRYAGFEIRIGDVFYRVVNDEDICIIERKGDKNE